jgi:hypothetical protein
MDPMFLSYSQANGVPQESKLATYMVNYLCLILLFQYISSHLWEIHTGLSVEYYGFDKVNCDKRTVMTGTSFVPSCSSACVILLYQGLVYEVEGTFSG